MVSMFNMDPNHRGLTGSDCTCVTPVIELGFRFMAMWNVHIFDLFITFVLKMEL